MCTNGPFDNTDGVFAPYRTKAEFDSIFAREILEEKLVILPVWHGVTKEQVFEYIPRLAHRVALNSQEGSVGLAKGLVQQLKESQRLRLL